MQCLIHTVIVITPVLPVLELKALIGLINSTNVPI